MSRVDLERLQDLYQSSTPGPWYQFGVPWFRDELGILAGSNDPHVATFVADLTPLEALDEESGQWAQNPGDAAFMVAAHRFLPALISELRVAREALRLAPRPPNFNTPTTEYVAALAAYDQVVAP